MAVAVTGLRGDASQAPANQQPPPAQPPAAAQPSGDQQPPLFRAGVNFVRVDVIVSDKSGNPVGDLSQADFEVTEAGKPQTIQTFKRIELDGGLIPGPDGPPTQIRSDFDEEREAARDDVRLFGLFLDDYHVRLGSSLSARNEIARFIETQLGPSDMIGVMYPLTPLDAVRFTRNHDAVMRGVQQFAGRKYDYQAKNSLEENYVCRVSTEGAESIRNDVSLSALRAMIQHMGSLKEGRKALILVSEGYNSMLPPQMRNPCACCGGAGNPNSQNPSAGVNDPLEDRAMMHSQMGMNDELRRVWDLANKQNVAIYAVDPRGLATGEFDIADNIMGQLDRGYLSATMDTLRTLALESDGRAIVNRNDLTMAMKQIVRDTSAYYLLGYNSSFTSADGKFHEIKVKVKRPGVQVRARRGYWAMTQEDVRRATEIATPKPGPPKAVETAIAAISQPARARVIRTWIGTERGDAGKTKVTFIWEPVPRAPGDTAAARSAGTAARVSVTAVAPDGAPYFRGRVPETAATAPVAGSSAAASRVVFDAQPGKMQLRLSVEGADAQVLDSEVREITIPDLTSTVALGTPEVFRARTVRDLQQLKADPKAVPTVGREFLRAERLLVRVPTYGPGQTTPKLTAKLLNRAGQMMTELAVAPSAASSSVLEIEVPLAPIAAGEYLLELTATGESGEVKELLGFRVTG
jgi:VWFA-related protein